MADDGGDVFVYLYRNNSYLKKWQKFYKIQLTTSLVSKKNMLTKKAMPYMQNKKLMLQLTV